MLVLTRKKTEEIRIGENITIKVIRCGKGAVKLGIDAPENVRVLRAELCLEPDGSTGLLTVTESGLAESVVAEELLAEDDLEEESHQCADATESGRLPEVDAGDLAYFTALIYPQAV